MPGCNVPHLGSIAGLLVADLLGANHFGFGGSLIVAANGGLLLPPA
jgi:hypothetical protein